MQMGCTESNEFDELHTHFLLDVFARYPELERDFPDLAKKAQHDFAGACYVQQVLLAREESEKQRQREAERQQQYGRAQGEENGAEEQEQSAAGGGSLVLTCLSDVTPQRVRWLWSGRIPLGKVTVLDGDPGLGKSLISTDIAGRTSRNRPMPDGTGSDLDDPAGVVILSAEDDLADTIRPRLEAAGADLSRIVHLTAVRTADDQRLPELSDLKEIREAIFAVNAKLVIVDPLMAFLPGKVDAHRDQDIRRSLAPLAALAAETGAAVLVIRHINKTEGRNALYRGGGSIGIVGAARSGLLVARDPDDQDGERRILVSTKCNLAKLPLALTYRVKTTGGGARSSAGRERASIQHRLCSCSKRTVKTGRPWKRRKTSSVRYSLGGQSQRKTFNVKLVRPALYGFLMSTVH